MIIKDMNFNFRNSTDILQTSLDKTHFWSMKFEFNFYLIPRILGLIFLFMTFEFNFYLILEVLKTTLSLKFKCDF